MQLGNQIGSYRCEAVPLWVSWAVRLPWLKRRLVRRAVSEIQVLEHGICLRQQAGAEGGTAIPYRDIRRVWFEQYKTGSEHTGNVSFRIDIIAENLDTLFTMTKVDCPPGDPDLQLMERLYDQWKAETWRHYEVVAAIVSLTAGEAGRTDLADPLTPVFLCMQKGNTRYDYTAYHWEFPGGKVEDGETEQDALRRELREEMDYEITVGQHVTTVEHRYRDFSLSLACYLCSATTATFTRKEHHDHRWLTLDEMSGLEWCAADFPALEALRGVMATGAAEP